MIFKYWKVIKLFFVIQIFIFIYVNLHEIQQQSETKLVVLKLNNSLTKFIDNANFKQYIRNKYFINKLLKENKTILVILIQVSSRLNYLKELISFLKNTRYINETLVIFSHDFINHQINNLIKNVTFCANLQIFYPYSLQIYSNKSFPGKDPNDCPKSIEKQKYLNYYFFHNY